MNIPYTTKELDSLIAACIEFTEAHDKHFAAFNIAGRQDVSADADVVERIMSWIAEMDKKILEYSGFDKDNIPNYRLGHDARQMMAGGGFKKYLSRKKMKVNLERASIWSPIGIALLALIISYLAWIAPNDSSKKIDELAAQLHRLQMEQAQTKSSVVTIQESLGAVKTVPTNAK